MSDKQPAYDPPRFKVERTPPRSEPRTLRDRMPKRITDYMDRGYLTDDDLALIVEAAHPTAASTAPYGMDEAAEKSWHKNHRTMRVTVPTCRLCVPTAASTDWDPNEGRTDPLWLHKRDRINEEIAAAHPATEGLDVERLRFVPYWEDAGHDLDEAIADPIARCACGNWHSIRLSSPEGQK